MSDISELNQYTLPNPTMVSSDFLESKRGKVAQIFAKEAEPVKFKKKEPYSIKFSTPIFVDKITITTGNNKASNLKLRVTSPNSKQTELVGKSNAEETPTTIYESKQFVSELDVINTNLLLTEQATSLKVFHLPLANLDEIAKTYASFHLEYENLTEKITNERNSLNDDKQEWQTEITTLEDKKSELNTDISKLTEANDEINEELTVSKEELQEIQNKHSEIGNALKEAREKETIAENNTQELKRQAQDLNSNIASLKTELKNLQNRKDLYAEDMANYIGESKAQLKFYYILSGLSIVLVAAIAGYSICMLDGLISEFIAANEFEKNIGAFDLFIIRAPYATVALSAIGALITLSAKSINKIFFIQSQRREIISLSVLARDISAASSYNLKDLEDEEIYRLREESKFKLLSQSILSNAFSERIEKKGRTTSTTKPREDVI